MSKIQLIIDRLEVLQSDTKPVLGFDMNLSFNCRHMTENACGTACCIGGHAQYLLSEMGEYEHYPNAALVRLCKIYLKDAELICYPQRSRWPDLDYQTITIDQALVVLKKFRDTGEVDWDVCMNAGYEAFDAVKEFIAAE